LPQLASLFGIEPREGAPAPKPLRPTRPAKKGPPPPPANAAPKATVEPADLAEVETSGDAD
jgi:hypothetical protein